MRVTGSFIGGSSKVERFLPPLSSESVVLVRIPMVKHRDQDLLLFDSRIGAAAETRENVISCLFVLDPQVAPAHCAREQDSVKEHSVEARAMAAEAPAGVRAEVKDRRMAPMVERLAAPVKELIERLGGDRALLDARAGVRGERERHGCTSLGKERKQADRRERHKQDDEFERLDHGAIVRRAGLTT
ncbi:MAG: hypothetical protein RML56_11990 [Burkholderiales bacterium]|nr:hypothetical protein [Burkholderiales bacterium]